MTRRWTDADIRAFKVRGVRVEVIDAGTKAPPERPNRRPWLTLVLPFPPTTNHDKAPGARPGLQYLTDETKAFRRTVAGVVQLQRNPWVGGTVEVAIALYPPDRRAYDIDNRIKPTLDALQGAGVIPNDRAVKRLIVSEVDAREGGQAIVTVQEIGK